MGGWCLSAKEPGRVSREATQAAALRPAVFGASGAGRGPGQTGRAGPRGAGRRKAGGWALESCPRGCSWPACCPPASLYPSLLVSACSAPITPALLSS